MVAVQGSLVKRRGGTMARVGARGESMSRKTGRQFFSNPGPTNIPDSVLRAMDRPSVDFMDPEFGAVYARAVAGLKRVLGTTGELFMYAATGHGAWEATLANLFSPGDTLVAVESGWFSQGWSTIAGKFGLEIKTVPADWRRGVDPAALTAVLRETPHAKGVLAVHSETSTGMALPIRELRDAIEAQLMLGATFRTAAGSDALLLVDTISSLGSLAFDMTEFGVDAAVGGSQKGLMLTTGMSFTATSAKAMEAHKTARIMRHYFDWSEMMTRGLRSFVGTVPTGFFYGLVESVRLIEEEGLENVVARHHRLAEATRLAVRAWAGNDGPQLYCLNPTRYSDSVTAILMPEGHNADAVRKTALDRFNVSTGGGLGMLNGKVLRIGHLGDLNEPMVLGTLAAVEMSMRAGHVPHGKGGVEAAMDYLAG